MKENRIIHSAVVTGPTGVLGSAVCKELAENNIEVYAVCRPGSDRIKNIPLNELIHIVELDISEFKHLPMVLKEHNAMLEQVDAFFSFAWTNTFGAGRNNMYAQIANVHSAIDAVHAAKELKCRVFLGAGSQAEYGRHDEVLKSDTPCFPENGYGIAKLCAGNMSRLECQKYDIDHIWMRVLSLYGPGDHKKSLISTVLRALEANETPALTAGKQIWNYLYSEDAAKAFLMAARYGKNGAVYPLGSGQTLTIREYVEAVRDIVNPEGKLGFGEIAYSEQQIMHLCADIKKLSEDTGWIPEVGFADGIRKLAKHRNDGGN